MNATLRFAPSPTGILHIGTARTAVINDILKLQLKGKSILRIEDTDQKRNQIEFVQQIRSSLGKIGIEYDRIIFQSHLINTHISAVNKLLKIGCAYRCPPDDCAQNNTTFRSRYRDQHYNGDEYAVRFKVPSGTVSINDQIAGKININCNQIEDFIIMRSNGQPTYNLACAIDDINLQITHIVRGNDHIINTAKHILIFNALQSQLPLFAHVPLMHSEKGDKLSKRLNNATNIEQLSAEGILGNSIWIYLASIGWEAPPTKELIIDKFDISRLSAAPIRFDLYKVHSINDKITHTIEYTDEIERYINPNPSYNAEICKQLFFILQKRVGIHVIRNIIGNIFNVPGAVNTIKDINDKNIIMLILDRCTALKDSSTFNMKNIIKDINNTYDIPQPYIYTALRIAILGRSDFPKIVDICNVIGYEHIVNKLQHLIS